MGVIVLNLNLVVKQGDFKRHVSVTFLSFCKSFIVIVLWLLDPWITNIFVIIFGGETDNFIKT